MNSLVEQSEETTKFAELEVRPKHRHISNQVSEHFLRLVFLTSLSWPQSGCDKLPNGQTYKPSEAIHRQETAISTLKIERTKHSSDFSINEITSQPLYQFIQAQRSKFQDQAHFDYIVENIPTLFQKWNDGEILDTLNEKLIEDGMKVYIDMSDPSLTEENKKVIYEFLKQHTLTIKQHLNIDYNIVQNLEESNVRVKFVYADELTSIPELKSLRPWLSFMACTKNEWKDGKNTNRYIAFNMQMMLKNIRNRATVFMEDHADKRTVQDIEDVLQIADINTFNNVFTHELFHTLGIHSHFTENKSPSRSSMMIDVTPINFFYSSENHLEDNNEKMGFDAAIDLMKMVIDFVRSKKSLEKT